MNDHAYIVKRGKRIAWIDYDEFNGLDLLSDIPEEIEKIIILTEDRKGRGGYRKNHKGQLEYDPLSREHVYWAFCTAQKRQRAYRINIYLDLDRGDCCFRGIEWLGPAPDPKAEEYKEFRAEYTDDEGEYWSEDEFVEWIASEDNYEIDAIVILSGGKRAETIAKAWLEEFAAIMRGEVFCLTIGSIEAEAEEEEDEEEEEYDGDLHSDLPHMTERAKIEEALCGIIGRDYAMKAAQHYVRTGKMIV